MVQLVTSLMTTLQKVVVLYGPHLTKSCLLVKRANDRQCSFTLSAPSVANTSGPESGICHSSSSATYVLDDAKSAKENTGIELSESETAPDAAPPRQKVSNSVSPSNAKPGAYQSSSLSSLSLLSAPIPPSSFTSKPLTSVLLNQTQSIAKSPSKPTKSRSSNNSKRQRLVRSKTGPVVMDSIESRESEVDGQSATSPSSGRSNRRRGTTKTCTAATKSPQDTRKRELSSIGRSKGEQAQKQPSAKRHRRSGPLPPPPPLPLPASPPIKRIPSGKIECGSSSDTTAIPVAAPSNSSDEGKPTHLDDHPSLALFAMFLEFCDAMLNAEGTTII